MPGSHEFVSSDCCVEMETVFVSLPAIIELPAIVAFEISLTRTSRPTYTIVVFAGLLLACLVHMPYRSRTCVQGECTGRRPKLLHVEDGLQRMQNECEFQRSRRLPFNRTTFVIFSLLFENFILLSKFKSCAIVTTSRNQMTQGLPRMTGHNFVRSLHHQQS